MEIAIPLIALGGMYVVSNQSNENPALTFRELGVEHDQKKILVKGKIESSIPAIAMIAYNDEENKGQRGYMVNNNYDATSWTSVISPDNEFKIRITDLREGNPVQSGRRGGCGGLAGGGQDRSFQDGSLRSAR